MGDNYCQKSQIFTQYNIAVYNKFYQENIIHYMYYSK